MESEIEPVMASITEGGELDEVNEEGAKGIAQAPPSQPTIRSLKREKAWALRSVLKVFVVRTEPNYAQPWQMRPQRSATGSAFVVDTEGRHIITNAHVVSNATSVHVRRPGNPKKWKATVLCEAKSSDLTLLTVEDPLFWEDDLRPLEFVDVPDLQHPIFVVGYPMGGDSLSITKGIVSRITMTRYAVASNKLLGIQIDAAINPGNSGGPAFADLEQGKVAGVAFSKITHADNVGYIIPWMIVAHFLSEYREHGTFRGSCSGGFRFQDMENTHLRAYLKVPENRSGCVVYKIDPLSEACQVLDVMDVVMEVDSVPIADDGTVQFRDDERVEFSHIVRCKHIGDTLHLTILRNGQEMEASYQLGQLRPLVPVLHGLDCTPSYFIVGGLVFVPLSIPFLEHAYGTRKWRQLSPIPLLGMITEYRSFADEQVVVLVQVLASELNFGYNFSTMHCHSFNGMKLHNLQHLAQLVDTCTDRYADILMFLAQVFHCLCRLGKPGCPFNLNFFDAGHRGCWSCTTV
ncbi:unnamed protein product [Ostreobium quekettii]|uniref:Protease Do-like PDZ domain-containing protein n=1 Tax=Ostreobium quekettii TaxID=121088 RepID=A0A8S1JCA3_9CHLO|nr:unnamed protein product [Ostreobium quekettii]